MMQAQLTLAPSKSRGFFIRSLPLFRIPCAWWWLVAQVFSLWPTWVWMGKRMSDGSDDPLGLLALAVLGISLWQLRHQLRTTPRLSALLASLCITLLATLSLGHLPFLLTGVVSMFAIAASLLAFLPQRIAKLPVLGLCILALPLLSSLQFYAGYPLRVITAEVSSWLLAFAYDVGREGSTLLINGKLIMVDAPCSGVQMAWLGYFTACTLALWFRLSNKQFMLRLPFVGALVLTGNIMRNSILVVLQAGNQSPPEWLHQGIGLVALGLVCLVIARLIMGAPPCEQGKEVQSTSNQTQRGIFPKHFFHAGLALFILCCAWAAHQAIAKPVLTATNTPFVEWPYTWRGAVIRPLALSEVEERFAQNFPGAITRMTDDQRVFVFRQVSEPTRKLHPAVDCYKGLGYRIAQEQLQTDSKGFLWRCFVATRDTQNLQVCEHIEDIRGQSYTDTSAWYWSALTKSDTGPWTTITIAKSMESSANTISIVE